MMKSNLPFFGSRPLHYRWYQKTPQLREIVLPVRVFNKDLHLKMVSGEDEGDSGTRVLYHLSRDAGHD